MWEVAVKLKTNSVLICTKKNKERKLRTYLCLQDPAQKHREARVKEIHCFHSCHQQQHYWL